MRYLSRLAKALLFPLLVGCCIIWQDAGARAEASLDPDAKKVLHDMSAFLGGLPSFSVEYASADEVVTQDGQRLQFLHSGSIAVQRPDRLHAVRRGAAGTSDLFLDAQGLTVFAQGANAYLRLPASSIEAAVDAVRRMGFDAPGGDFLVPRPLDNDSTDVVSGTHVGMTFVDGREVHQLAFRGTDVDWQLWVTTGDKPLPVRYVITTRSVPGAPQFTLQLSNWDVAPRIDAARFTFTPPPNARRLEPSAVTANAIGDFSIKGD